MTEDELQRYIKNRLNLQKECMDILLEPSITYYGYDEFDMMYINGDKTVSEEQAKNLLRYYGMSHGSSRFMIEVLSSKGQVDTKWLKKMQKNPLDVGYQEVDTFNEQEFKSLAYNPLDIWYCCMALCAHYLNVGNLARSLDFLIVASVTGKEINITLSAKISTHKIRRKIGANGQKIRNANLYRVKEYALERYRELLSRKPKISARSAASIIKPEVVSYGATIGFKFTSEDPQSTMAKWINKAK